MPTIESLDIQIQAQGQNAADGIDALSRSLRTLRDAVAPVSKGGAGLTALSNSLQKFSSSISGLSGLSVAKEQIQGLADALKPLESVQKSGFSSLASGLNNLVKVAPKIGSVTEALRNTDLDAFADQCNRVAAAITPLATEMQKVAAGFSAFPAKIQRLLQGNTSLTASNAKLSSSYVGLAAKIAIAYAAIKRIATVVASAINKSNEYIENLNLFNASMGSYAKEAQEYAELVGDVMGIDPGVWMRNQGIFMTLATGFGVVNDRAYTMSKNLTQLGYDISSFFNISYEESMQKLQSGISGELEPLRRLGYDLSQAKLQAVALSLGIDQSVNSMTQAQKAELRYYAIMTQVTTAQGDMARTLTAPANQLRILKAEAVQAARAFGNIFIPILNAVLPVVIAVTKVIRLLAATIASLFGFSLPEVDYSSISAGAGSAGDLADNLGGAGKEAKKLKDYLLGIDELNVIKPEEDTGSGGGSGGIGSGGGGFDFALPEYTFLDEVNSKVNEIVEKIKEWLGLTKDIDSWTDLMHTRLGYILTIVGSIGLAFAAWKAVSLIEKVIAGIVGAGGALKGFTALWGKFKTKLGGLSVISKVVLSLAALAAEFLVVKSAVQNAIEGNISWGEAALGIIPVCAAVGVAMYAMLGPWGLVAAAVVAVVAAIVGWISAVKQSAQEAYEATEEYQVMSKVIADSEAIIQRSADALGNVSEKLNGIKEIDANWFTVRSLTDEIFDLSDKTNKTAYETVLLQTKVQMLNDMNIDGLKLSIDETTGKIVEERAAIDKVIEGLELQAKQAALQNVLTEAYEAQYRAMFDNQTATLDLSAAQEQYNTAVATLQEVSDRTSFHLFNTEFQTAKVAVEHAEEALRTAAEAVDASKGTYDELAGTITSVTEQYAALTTEITTGADAIGGALPDGMVEGIEAGASGVVSAAQALGNDASDAVREVLGVHSPSTVFEEIGDNCGLGLKNGLAKHIQEIAALFKGDFTSGVISQFENVRTNIVTKMESAKQSVQNAWSAFAPWFDTSVATPITTKMQSLSTNLQNSFAKAKQAIQNAWITLPTWFGTNIVTPMQNKIGDYASWYSAGRTAMDAWVDGLKSIEMPQFHVKWTTDRKFYTANGKTYYVDIPVPDIRFYAMGGFPESGELFVAREAGAEMVGNIGGRTAVANNDQIVEAVALGVYEAMTAAMNSDSQDDNTKIVINLDGQKIYENQQKIARGKGYNLGMGAFA